MSGTWLALGAILLWSTTATAFELSLDKLTTVQLMAGATVVSAVFFGVVSAVSKRTSVRDLLGRRNLLRSAVLGLLNPLLYYVLLFGAYTRLPGHHALIFNYTWPLFLALLAGPILGKRPGPRVAAGLLVSFAGVVVMYVQNREAAEADPLGMALALASAVVWAVAWLITMSDRRPAVSKLFGAFCFGSVYAVIAVLVTGSFRSFSPAGIPNVVYVALAEMGLSFLLWLRGLEKSANPGATGNLAYAAPFLSLLALRLVIREQISVFALLGLVLIVGGIIIGKTGTKVPR